MDAATEPATAGGIRELEITRTFKAPRALVFKMWTQPEHIVRWWGCHSMQRNDVTNDLRVGGTFRSEMTLDDGAKHIITGTYLEIDEPARLSFTWNVPSGAAGSETVVTVDLADEDGHTRMTLRHAVFDRPDYCEQHYDGWSASVDRLAALLSVAPS